MKIDITIRDASPQEAQSVFDAINPRKVSVAPSATDTVMHPHFAEQTNPPVQTPVTPETHPNGGFPGTQVPVTPETHPSNSTPVVHTNGPNAGTTSPEGAKVDGTGLVWDERIHAGSQAINADGKWKKRKGVQSEYVATIEAELRGGAASAPTNLPNFNTQPAEDTSDIPAHMRGNADQPSFNNPTGFPGTQAPQTQVNDPAQNGEVTFASLMSRINNATAAGKIDGMYIVGLCSRLAHMHGAPIASLTDLMNRPVIIKSADAMMSQDNKGI